MEPHLDAPEDLKTGSFELKFFGAPLVEYLLLKGRQLQLVINKASKEKMEEVRKHTIARIDASETPTDISVALGMSRSIV